MDLIHLLWILVSYEKANTQITLQNNLKLETREEWWLGLADSSIHKHCLWLFKGLSHLVI